MTMIDARGFSCPEPVIMLRKAMIEKGPSYEIIVDNRTSLENISRFASHQGYAVEYYPENGDYVIHLTKE